MLDRETFLETILAAGTAERNLRSTEKIAKRLNRRKRDPLAPETIAHLETVAARARKVAILCEYVTQEMWREFYAAANKTEPLHLHLVNEKMQQALDLINAHADEMRAADIGQE
jgi:hypothetical protein